MSTLLNLYRKRVTSGVEESHENLVSLCLGLDDFIYRVHCASEFWSFDMVESQESPNDAPCGPNYFESVSDMPASRACFLHCSRVSLT
jgi:hypothetical protein